MGGGPTAYGGAGGGSSIDIDMQQILRNYGQTAANTTAQMANASRAAGMNLIPQAPGIAQGANAQLLAPATTTGLAGQQQQTYAQQAINDALARYQAQQAAPWAGVSPMTQLIQALGGTSASGTQTGTSQSQTTYQPSTPSLMTQILQGALGAAAGGAALFGGGPMGAPSAFQNIMGLFTGGNAAGNAVAGAGG